MKSSTPFLLAPILGIAGLFASSSATAAETSALDLLSDLSCKMCNDDQYRDDLKKIEAKYGKQVNEAAAKQNLSLSPEELTRVFERIRSSEYDEVCNISFGRVRVLFQNGENGKLGTTREKFEEMAKDVTKGPFLKREAFTSKVAKTENIQLPLQHMSLMNSFADCEKNKLSKKGEEDFILMREELKKHLTDGGRINDIDLHCSTSTLRNTCGADKSIQTITPIELSSQRCQYVQDRLTNELNNWIKEENKKPNSVIPLLGPESFHVDIGAENKDGTSGPVPPSNYSCAYNIHGNGNPPHDNIADYDQYKFAKLSVSGTAPKKSEAEVVSGETYYKPFFQNCNPMRPKAFNGLGEYHGQCPKPQSNRGGNTKARQISGKKAKEIEAERMAEKHAKPAGGNKSAAESN